MFQRLDFQSAFELSKKEDLYQRLGVSRDATPEDIYTATVRLLVVVHPHRNQERREAAVQATHLIREACKTLSDTETRRAYDQQHHPEAPTIDWSNDLRIPPTAQPTLSPRAHLATEALKKVLDQRNITLTKESIIQWLENPHTTPNSFELLTVIWASKALGLLTPEDIRNNTGIYGAFLARLVSGQHHLAPDQSAASSPTSLNPMPINDPPYEQKFSALQSLACFLDDQSSFRYLFGVCERHTDHFRSLKNELIKTGILSVSEINESPQIREATRKLSIAFEERLRAIQDGHLLHDATKAFVNFIEEHSLTIPEEIRQTLVATYSKRLDDCIAAEPVRFFYGVGYDCDKVEEIRDLKSRLGPQPIKWL